MATFARLAVSFGAASLASFSLSACGGGGSSPSGGLVAVTPAPTPTPTPVAAVPPAAVVGTPTDVDATRLAQQATFGPTPQLIASIQEGGLDRWIDGQFAAKGSTYSDIARETTVASNYCQSGNPGASEKGCSRRYFSRDPVAMRFYGDAMNAPDQLRQRIAFALSQILVVSELEVPNTAALATYHQILLDGALGNYRDLLLNVTRSSAMGSYLDMADSSRSAPSENFARELMQLFSMGTDALNLDGSTRRDSTGAPLPNYSVDDIKGISRALTGWTFARLNGAAITDNVQRDFSQSMIKVPARYDSAAKEFLGTTVPAGATQEASVAAVVDAVFNNASTAPHISRQLIQHLVKANPSPAYIQRVASVFTNNGAGVRGDMKAVVRAILIDSEARGPLRNGTQDGKLKEPILAMIGLTRLLGMTSDGYAMVLQDIALGQPVFRASSVFNYYPPNQPLQGSATLVSPASKLFTTPNILRFHNLVYNWTVNGDQASRYEFTSDPGISGWTGTTQQWSSWETFGTNTSGMIERINLLMTGNALTPAHKAALLAAANAITHEEPAMQARKRAQLLLSIVATSPFFLVDR